MNLQWRGRRRAGRKTTKSGGGLAGYGSSSSRLQIPSAHIRRTSSQQKLQAKILKIVTLQRGQHSLLQHQSRELEIMASSSASSSSSSSSQITTKWMGFVVALWVQAISGNNYTFANYSVALKAILQCNQVQLNTLSVAKDVGKAFGLVAGLLSDVLPPWSILLIGSVEGLLGYGAQWLVVSQTVQPLPYWVMCVVMCMGGNSTTWMNTAVLVTCVRNFRRNRGPVSGILKAYVGLSTAIFTDLCAALFTSDPASFVLMLAVIPLAVCTLAMFFLRPVEPSHSPREDQEESRGFAVLNVVAIVLALYLLAYDLSGTHSTAVSTTFAVGLLIIVAAPVVLPVYLKLKLSSHETAVDGRNCWSALCGRLRIGKGDAAGNDGSVPLLKGKEEEEKQHASGNGAAAERDIEGARNGEAEAEDKDAKKDEDGAEAVLLRRPKLGEEHTIPQALRSVDFWLLFFSFLCGVGTGMAVINNMGQIGESLGYSSTAIFVSFISIWGFFGRLGSGALSEYLIRSRAVPRPVVLAMSEILMIVGYILLAVAIPGSLYIGSIIVGICYGVRLAVSVPVASEMFGLKSFGLMYNLLILNLPLGSFLFSGLLAGFLYDIEAQKDGSNGLNATAAWAGLSGANHTQKLWSGEIYENLGGGSLSSTSLTCLGAHCYRTVFIVMAVVSAVGSGLDVILAMRTRSLYERIQRSKLAQK